MVAGAILAIAALVGVPFYLRFLIALCGEYRAVRIRYLVRVQPAVVEIPLADRLPERVRRAA